MCLVILKSDAKFEEKLISCFKKWQEFDEFWPEHSKVSKIYTLIDSYCAKFFMCDLKKYGGIIFHVTEDWCKIWRKTDLWFEKWHEKFDKFSVEYSKVSKLELLWGPFVESRKFMNLKSTEKLCVMTMRNDTKFEEDWLVISKLTSGICKIVTRAPENLKYLLFNWLHWPKYIMFKPKK